MCIWGDEMLNKKDVQKFKGIIQKAEFIVELIPLRDFIQKEIIKKSKKIMRLKKC